MLFRSLADKSVDLVLTDPHYGIDLEYASYDDTEQNWFNLMDKFIPQALRISNMSIFPSCKIKRLGWFYANYQPDWIIAWYKGSVGHNSFVGFNDWEPHLVYGKTKTKLCMHDYFQTTSSPKMGSYGHPCPKPIEWASWLIYRATDENMVVLDPFAGDRKSVV